MVETKVECETCVHKNVCMHKNEFEYVQECVDRVSINLTDGANGHIRTKCLKDISYIEPIRLRCIHYVADKSLQPTIRNDWSWDDITGTTGVMTLTNPCNETEVIGR